MNHGIALALRFRDAAIPALQHLLLLGLRLYLASVFFSAGLTKIRDWQSTLSLFRYEYSVPLLPPAFAAVLGTGGELLLPVLLAFGAGTRFAAAGLLILNCTAVISYPVLWTFECPAAIQSHFFWGAGLLVLMAFGPGRASMDAFRWQSRSGAD